MLIAPPCQKIGLFLLAGLLCAACTEMPEIAAPPVAPGPALQIAPLDAVLAQMPPPGSVVTADPTGLAARAAALRARADALRGPLETTPAPGTP